MADATLGVYNIEDMRAKAQKRLPKGVFEFVDRGCEDEVALRNNRAAFERIKLSPRPLVDVSKRSQAIELFGEQRKMPIIIAPTGVAGLMWYQGELELARAAAAAGIPFTMATGSMTAMETVAEQAGGRLWFQLYMWPDRSMSHQLVQRAERAGFEALVVTIDGVVAGNREYNLRNGFTIPFTYKRRNVLDVLRHPRWMIERARPLHARHRHAALRELSRRAQEQDHRCAGGPGAAAQRQPDLGRPARAAQDLAAHADRQRHHASARCAAGGRLRRRRRRRVEPRRAQLRQPRGPDRRAARRSPMRSASD